MANISQLPIELIVLIIKLVLDDPVQSKYADLPVPVNIRSDYIDSAKCLRWKQTDLALVTSLRLICKKIQTAVDLLAFDNLACSFSSYIEDDNSSQGDTQNPMGTSNRKSYDFNFYNNLISKSTVSYYRTSIVNNRFRDRYFRMSRKKGTISQQQFVSLPVNCLLFSNKNLQINVRHLFLGVSACHKQILDVTFLLSQIEVGLYPSLNEITIEFLDDIGVGLTLTENFHKQLEKSGIIFHLILRTQAYCQVLDRLGLKEFIHSLTLDFCKGRNYELDMNFISNKCPKVNTLIIGGIFASLSGMENILLLQSLEELVLPISAYVRMPNPSRFALAPTIQRLTIDFYDFMMALKSGQKLDSLTHLQIIVQIQFNYSFQNVYDIFFNAAHDASMNELGAIAALPDVFRFPCLECLEFYCKTNIFQTPEYDHIVISSIGKLVKANNVKLFTLQMYKSEFSPELMQYLDSVEELNVVDLDSSSLISFQIERLFERPMKNLRYVTFSLFSTYFPLILDLFLGDLAFLKLFPVLESITGLFEHFANDDPILLQKSLNHVYEKIEESMAESEWRKNFSIDEMKSVLEIVMYENVVTTKRNQLRYTGSIRSMQNVHPVCFLINFHKVKSIVESRNSVAL
jgi:hypothetical protein